MIDFKKLKRKLYNLYPLYLGKKNHDFVGQMVSSTKTEINRIVLCLDLDEEVIEKCLNFNPDLIITHHPFLYGQSKVTILRNDPHKKKIFDILKERNIGVISLHTNFDEASGGMNDELARLLKLKFVYAPTSMPMMRIGELKIPLEINNFAYYAKERLNVSYASLTKAGNDIIRKVAIIGGGGSRYYNIALEEGADIYISGDVPHHIRRGIVADKFNYLDVPHEVERVFINKMYEDLLKIDDKLDILLIDHEIEPKIY